MADTTENKAPVDETPISAVKANSARKNSLSNYLKHRPERSELVDSTSHDAQLSISPLATEMNRRPPDGGCDIRHASC